MVYSLTNRRVYGLLIYIHPPYHTYNKCMNGFSFWKINDKKKSFSFIFFRFSFESFPLFFSFIINNLHNVYFSLHIYRLPFLKSPVPVPNAALPPTRGKKNGKTEMYTINSKRESPFSIIFPKFITTTNIWLYKLFDSNNHKSGVDVCIYVFSIKSSCMGVGVPSTELEAEVEA